MNNSSSDWNNLASAVLTNEALAVKEFVHVVGGYLWSFMAKWLPEHADFELAAAETLTDVVNSIEKFDSSKASLKTWVRCIASRRVADYYRLNERREKSNDGVQEMTWREKYHQKTRLPASVRTDLVSLMSSLRPDDHELLRLFFEEQHSDSEVGEILGITPSNARQRKLRLVKKLQTAISTITTQK